MRTLLLTLLLSACASQTRQAPFTPPDSAANHLELVQAIPQELYRGDLEANGADFVFLKNESKDQVPMRVAVYHREGGRLVRDFVAPTPFAPGDCRRGECRARISMMPNGFQLSRESFGADRLRADYRFVVDGHDLALTGKGFQAKRPGGDTGRDGVCSEYFDFEKGRVLRRTGPAASSEPLKDKRPHLIADALRFDAPAAICGPATASSAGAATGSAE